VLLKFLVPASKYRTRQKKGGAMLSKCNASVGAIEVKIKAESAIESGNKLQTTFRK
jgi:hypothetical protein